MVRRAMVAPAQRREPRGTKPRESISAGSAVSGFLPAATATATGGLAAGFIALAALTGCTVDSGHPGHGYSSGGSAAPGNGSSTAAPVQPLLVDVDSNQTLETTPGDGLGVYVEYQTGGHWVVWWTCDTNRTGYDCHYQIDANASQGSLTNVAGQHLETNDSLTQPSAQQVTAITTTSTSADGMTFDATAGAMITLSVQVDADVYFFFVQDGKVNGGYQGALTNPLMFQPTSP